MNPSTALPQSIDALVAGHLGQTFTACAISVCRLGRSCIERAWGDTGAQPVRTDTWFDLASVTKLFTATAFLGLAGEGRVGLDDPIVTVIPEFGASGPRPPEPGQDPHTLRALTQPAGFAARIDPRAVTFRHLLTHTAGLQAWRDLFLRIDPQPGGAGRQGAADRVARALAAIGGFGFAGRPGTNVRYSDLGFILLGAAVERLSGLRLDAAIDARVVSRLACPHLAFDPVGAGRLAADAVPPTELDLRWRGRRVQGEVHDENACAMGGIAGHAGLFGSAAAVAAFGEAWLRDPEGHFGIPAALALAARSEQACTTGNRRGLGFMLKAVDAPSCGTLFDPASFGHTGYTGTSLWVDPRRDLVVACLTNAVFFGRDMTAIHGFRRALHDLLAQHADRGG